MHIGYLIQQYAPEVGAGPARAGEMAHRWAEAGHAITVHTGMPNRPEGRIYPAYRGHWSQREMLHGVEVRRTWLYARPGRGLGTTLLNNVTFAASAGLDMLLSPSRCDVLIASAPPFFPHMTGAVTAWAGGMPLVLEVRDLWPDYLVEMGLLRGIPARMLFALERVLLRRAALIVTVTESLRQRVLQKGIPSRNVTVITNGVDPSRYFRAEEAPPVAAVRHVPGQFLVGYLGNFGRGQDLTVVVRAAAELAIVAPHIRFVMAGDGPDGNRIRDEATRLHLPNLTILPSIPKEATRPFYNACDACLVPLAPLEVFNDALPSKLFEILACERPVIASVSGEAARLVLGADAGLVAPAGDVSALVRAIVEMASISSEVRDAMGGRGRAAVMARYSRDVLAERYLELLCGVVGRSTK